MWRGVLLLFMFALAAHYSALEQRRAAARDSIPVMPEIHLTVKDRPAVRPCVFGVTF